MPKDWCKTWSLSVPILESKVYIFGHSTKSADNSLLVVFPEDHLAAKVTEQKCFLCVSQAADATWGKCVKPVTPRALRKTGYRTKAFLNSEECLQM